MSISVSRRREARPNHIRKSRSDRVFDAVIYTAAALLTLIALYPMYFIVIASISDPNLVARGDVLLYPRGVSLEGYSYLFSMSNLWTGYGNTVLYTLAGTLIMLIVNIPVAFALSRKDLPGRGFFTFYFIFPMFFGGGLIPTFIILNNTFHMLDSFLVMVLPFSVISYYIIVARTFFQTSLPGELWDAAQIDGCSNLRYFFQIVLPLSKAILAVIALWAAVGHWNSYFNAMIYLRSPERYPLQLIMRNILINNEMAATAMTGSAAADLNRKANLIKYGAIVVSSLPIMTMYPFVQKYFNQGVMIGALKG
ncbi:MAG: carbohydrate ABC transporter permease [Clostridia bacterium]|nr:carbohydrate ABC transporter permease [Clostridia bacterium]